MRLVEKKCPNCGGELKFGFEDKETTCEFCGRSFEIERDEKVNNDNDERFNADYYSLTEEQKEVAKKVLGTFTIAPIIIGIIFISVFVVIAVTQFRQFGHRSENGGSLIVDKDIDSDPEELIEEVKKTAEEKLKEQGYVMSFDDLKENHLKDIHENTLTLLNKDLKRHQAFLYKYDKFSYVGMYLLTNSRGNTIYDVYKINFTIKGKKVPYFSAVRYRDAKINEGKLIVDMDGTVFSSLNMSSGPNEDATAGYESAKDLYNKLIRGSLAESKVYTIGGVYKE